MRKQTNKSKDLTNPGKQKKKNKEEPEEKNSTILTPAK
jgi:hypothetical protein